jgi:hypothetical protein
MQNNWFEFSRFDLNGPAFKERLRHADCGPHLDILRASLSCWLPDAKSALGQSSTVKRSVNKMFFSGKSKKSRDSLNETRESEASKYSDAPRRGPSPSYGTPESRDLHAVLAENAQLKSKLNSQREGAIEAVRKAESEQLHAVQIASQLRESLRESEERFTMLRTGFMSLDGVFLLF